MAKEEKAMTIRRPGQDALMPRSFSEIHEFASAVHQSEMCPKGWNEATCIVAIIHGLEVGMKPMQAIQGVAVINNKPTVYGDALAALARQHPDFEWMKEDFEGTYDEPDFAAWCTVKRKGDEPRTVYFSIADATQAGKWDSSGPWKSYPKRMLQMRARSWAIRDMFPDALMGMYSAEEAQDIPEDGPKDITSQGSHTEDFRPANIQTVEPDEKDRPDPVEWTKAQLALRRTTKSRRDWFERKKFDLREKCTDDEFAIIEALIPKAPGPKAKVEDAPDTTDPDVPDELSDEGKALYGKMLGAKNQGFDENDSALNALPEDDQKHFAR